MSRQGQRPSHRAGGCPLFHAPPPVRPRRGPDLHTPPKPALVAGNPTPQDLFSGPVRPPRRPLQPKARMPRPRSGRGQATARPRGRRPGGRGAAGTQRALCGAAGRLQPRTHTPGRNTGPRNPVAQGSGGGAGWATCPVALGRAHKAASRDSRLALRPLQSSPGLSPPHRDERGPDWELSPGWQ